MTYFSVRGIKVNPRSGFTLIELLVVISIIGLLASVVMASLNSARAKGRDAKRKADFSQIVRALELYYDTYNAYPPSTPVCNPGENERSDYWCRDARNINGVTPIQNWIPGLQEFMTSMPHNPKPYSPDLPFPYHYYSDLPNRYYLVTALENTSDRDTCGGGTIYTWIDGVTNTCPSWGAGQYARTVR